MSATLAFGHIVVGERRHHLRVDFGLEVQGRPAPEPPVVAGDDLALPLPGLGSSGLPGLEREA